MKRAYAFIMLSAAGVACFASIDVIYFQAVGYSLAFIGVMTAAFNLAVTAAELPFAILFDRYSNKLALQLGNLLRVVAFALFFVNLNEPTLLLAQVVAGVAVAAMSGTSNALVVNQIQASDANKIAAAFGRIAYLSASAALFGGIIGISMFAVWPEGIWLAAILFFVAAGVVIVTFHDTKADIEKIPLRSFLRQALGTARAPHAWLLVVTNAAAVAPFLLWQIKFDQVSLVFLAVGYVGMNAANILGPLLLRVLKVRVGHVALIAALNVIAAAIFAAADGAVAVWLSFVVHVALHCALQILVSGLFHEGIPNTIRATAGSVISMADSLIVAIVAPLVAIVGQAFGIGWGVAISAVLYLVVALGSIGRRIRTNAEVKAEVT
jgi:MFS family permease